MCAHKPSTNHHPSTNPHLQLIRTHTLTPTQQAHSDLGGWVIGLPFLVAAACDFVGSILAWLIFKFSPELQPGASDAADGCVGWAHTYAHRTVC